MVAAKNATAPARQASTKPYRCSTMTNAAPQRKPNVTVAVTREAVAITSGHRAPLASFFQRAESRSNIVICASLPAPGHADQKAEPQCKSQRGDGPLLDHVSQRVADRRHGVLRGVRDLAGPIGCVRHHGINISPRFS